MRHRNIDFWRLVPHCLMWCVWSERNARCFEGCEWSLLEIKSFFLHTLLDWSAACRIFLAFPFLFCLIIVILVPDFCPHSTSLMYSGWLFFIYKIFLYLSKMFCLLTQINNKIKQNLNVQIFHKLLQSLKICL